MNEPFGKMLRRLRLEAGYGLREAAAMIQKSPGYLSDVEQDRVAPPSEKVIIRMAQVLGIEKDFLLQAARKVDPEITAYVSGQPPAADFLRMAREEEFDNDDWKRLKQLARISKLGKEGRGKQ
jgi:transcriptional regulator with XRE-family HTH domain